MTVAEILNGRVLGTISDEQAIAELVEIGETEASAREMLALQDELFGDDNIEQ